MPDEENRNRERSYIVLRQRAEVEGAAHVVGLGRTFVEVGDPITALNAKTAIRERAGETEGVYVAVPARSFEPITVTIATETVVKLA